MMMKNSNISHTVKNNLCTGCGVCEDICPKHCITIQRIDGEHRPVVNEDTCNRCSKCLNVCPGIGIDFIKHQPLSEGQKYDKYIGRYVGLHTGYSLDDNMRYHSASGGMVSQFIIYLLDKNVIDGAVVTGYKDDHITPYSYIARTKDEVIKARSSKYCPVALNGVGNDIASRPKGERYVIVGTPCHIQGFRKRMTIDRKLRERVVGLFSIYCSSGRTFNGQDYLLKHYGVEKKDIKYFAYRDEGCLGQLTIQGKEMISIPFTSYYGPLLKSFFKPHRCLTCIDHYGELADVCFGDIHIHPYDKDKIGTSSWITRTKKWEDHFLNAVKYGYIKMDNIDAGTMNRGQATMLYPKSRRAQAVVNMDKLLGRVVPKYDRAFDKPNLKDYICEIVCHCQRFVGRNKGLWWIIELLGKNK